MRVPARRPEELDPAARTLYDQITGGPRATGPQHFALTRPDGSLRGPFNALLLSPALGGALQELGAAVRYRTALTEREREIAILLVAARWDSAFEREAHEAVGAAAGLDPERLEALRRQDATAFEGRELLVAQTVLALLDGDLDDPGWQRAEEGLGAPTIFELSTLVGYYAALALQLRVFRVAP